MHIRAFHPSDTDPILTLLRLNTPAYFAPEEAADLIEYLAHRTDLYYVVEIDGAIRGCGGINRMEDGKTARISWDIVHPDDQGKGIGRALTEFRIREIQQLPGIETIVVRTTQLVYPFYERFGFALKEVVPDYWAEGLDLYEMVRKV